MYYPVRQFRHFPRLMNMRIDYLANHQRHIQTLASWFKAENQDFFARSSLSDVAREHFESRLNTASLPISFIALVDGEPVGTIALLVESVTTHTHLSPWLGGLHVHPEFRHRGIGMALVAHGLKKALELGMEGVYAGISRAEARYVSEGWRVEERVMYCGKPLCVMKYDLQPHGSGAEDK
ncbi:MAG TPA: GNAT family N-acetyltransferase [Pyrinomonadaceae bacterium]